MSKDNEHIEESMYSEFSPITGEKNDVKPSDSNNTSLSADDKLAQIENHFEKQRQKWGKMIVDLVKEIRDVNQLIESQVTMLSYRQMLVDQLIKINIRLRKSETVYDKEYQKRFITYFNYDYKLNDKQKEFFVNADLSFHRRQISILESYADYYKECIKTLDQMGWAIKNRININKDIE